MPKETVEDLIRKFKFGKFLGEVTHVHIDDGTPYVKARIPQFGFMLLTEWAPIQLSMAGSQHDDNKGKYGEFRTPQIGDRVIIEFLNGDVRLPLVTGYYYPKGKIPSEAVNFNYLDNLPEGGSGKETTYPDYESDCKETTQDNAPHKEESSVRPMTPGIPCERLPVTYLSKTPAGFFFLMQDDQGHIRLHTPKRSYVLLDDKRIADKCKDTLRLKLNEEGKVEKPNTISSNAGEVTDLQKKVNKAVDQAKNAGESLKKIGNNIGGTTGRQLVDLGNQANSIGDMISDGADMLGNLAGNLLGIGNPTSIDDAVNIIKEGSELAKQAGEILKDPIGALTDLGGQLLGLNKRDTKEVQDTIDSISNQIDSTKSKVSEVSDSAKQVSQQLDTLAKTDLEATLNTKMQDKHDTSAEYLTYLVIQAADKIELVENACHNIAFGDNILEKYNAHVHYRMSGRGRRPDPQWDFMTDLSQTVYVDTVKDKHMPNIIDQLSNSIKNDPQVNKAKKEGKNAFDFFGDIIDGLAQTYDDLVPDDIKNWVGDLVDDIANKTIDAAKSAAMEAINTVIPVETALNVVDIAGKIMSGDTENLVQDLMETGLNMIPGMPNEIAKTAAGLAAPAVVNSLGV